MEALAEKVVTDTTWRDRNYPILDSGEKTGHELRQEQLTASKVVKALTHIEAPRIIA
jgi:predicted dinucleotide-binding enzyme